MCKVWPKTVEEAVAHTLRSMSDEDKKLVRETPEDELIGRFHHGWGTGIRNSFGLLRGNTELLASCGSPDNADSASSVIIQAVWKKLQVES